MLRCDVGEVIFSADDPADTIMYVVKGTGNCRLSRDGAKRLSSRLFELATSSERHAWLINERVSERQLRCR